MLKGIKLIPLLREYLATRNSPAAQAAATPAVMNGWLTPALMTYLLAWHGQVKTGRHASVICDALGADLLTPLHLFDPKIIGSTSPQPVDPEEIRFFLQHWDIVDKETATLPHNIKIKDLSPEVIGLMLQNDISCRTRDGFWPADSLKDWSPERCLVMDLKGIGIDRWTIELGAEEGIPCLTFKWGLPGHFPTSRTVIFYPGPFRVGTKGLYIRDLREGRKIPFSGEFDCFYSKSGHGFQSNFNLNHLWPLMAQRVRRSGSMFSGVPHRCTLTEGMAARAAIRQSLGRSFSELQTEYFYAVALEELGVDPHGWKLFGWRKL